MRALMIDALALERGSGFEVEPIENVFASGHRTAGQTAGQDLRERSQIGRDAEQRLRTAGMNPKAGHHFIEDQQRAMFARQLAQRIQHLG